MTRKHLILLLPCCALLLFAGLWAILRPEGSSLLPFIGEDDARTSHKVDVKPIGVDDLDADADALGDPNKGATEASKPEQAPEETDNVEAETSTARPRPRRGNIREKNPRTNRPARELTPEKKALELERQKRIEKLKSVKRPPNQTLGNHRPRARRLKKEVGKMELDEVTAELKQDRRGLYAKYYAFSRNPLAALLDPEQPTLDQREPDITRIDPQVHFPGKDAWADLPFDKRNFMGVWEGFLVIEEAGDYWLYIGADYSARVVLSGETVLLNDMRDYTEVSTVLTLSEGLHPIRIEYMEGENGSPVDSLGACNFMWVPEGESKPVPVPPEMLMLPGYLWSNHAPIITSVSNYSKGAIGDEVTIHGQGLGFRDLSEKNGVEHWHVAVTFAGQPAKIVKSGSSRLRVRVPVGAQSGDIIVYRLEYNIEKSAYSNADDELDEPPLPTSALTLLTVRHGIPSNSVDFTVTTQFGLYATWHDLEGWSNYDFVDESLHEPDFVRLERDFMFETREELDHSFRNNPLACHWEGKLGIPTGWVKEGETALVRFETNGRLRAKLGDQWRETEALTQEQSNQTTLDFEITNHEEHYLPLSIDWTSESGPASLRVMKMKRVVEAPVEEGGQPGVYWEEIETVLPHLFFPPIVPPSPPRILNVIPIRNPAESWPRIPFEINPKLVPVFEGQTCDITIEFSGKFEIEEFRALGLTIDGKALEWTYANPDRILIKQEKDGRQSIHVHAVLPSGLGEGRMVARQSIVTSEPFFIDILNKGLIAYLYDLPNPGGYQSMPDPGPLTCFQIRKHSQIDFENANEFDLPFPAETFAIEWLGAIIIEEEGDYRFTTRSDDGVKVWVDENIVLADDNLHYQREKTGDWFHLVPGVYDFRMQFFENNVHEVCVLEWDARVDSADEESEFLQRQVVGKRHFTWDQHPVLPAKTGAYKRADGSNPE